MPTDCQQSQQEAQSAHRRGDSTTTVQAEAGRAAMVEALRAERDRAQQYLDIAGVTIVALDAQGAVTLINKRGLELLGCEEEQVIGKNWFEHFIPAGIRTAVAGKFQELMAGEIEPAEYHENPVLTQTGQERMVAWHNTVIRDPAGKIAGTLSSGEDITERVRAEHQLQRRLEFEQTVSAISSRFVGAPDIDQAIQASLEDMGRLSGASRAYLFLFREDGTTTDNTHEWCAPGVSAQIHNLQGLSLERFPWSMTKLRQGEAVQVEDVSGLPAKARVLRETLEAQGIKSLLMMPLSVGQEVRGFVGFDDVAQAGPWGNEDWALLRVSSEIMGIALQRRRAEEAQRESENRFRALIEQSPFSTIVYRPDGTVLYGNPAALKLHELSGREYGAIIADYNILQDEQLEAKGSMPYLRKGFSGEATTIPPIQYVSQKRDRSGQAGQQVVWIEGFVYPIKDERGCIQQVVLIHNDISERVQAEAEREALIGELETNNAELERFTYTVSHDLKSPLITIQGFLGFLEQDARAGNVERVQADIARISAAAQRMEQLLSELLELSRIGRMVNPSEQVSFEELAQEALYMMEGRLDQRGVEARIAPELLRPDGPTVYGDRPRLREVLDNLVDNAIKFMGSQPHPQVEIGVRHDEKERVFYVRDNGMGIDPPYHEKVFGLFEKLDAETDGSGVGLAIVKRIVQVHGGRVWVESEGAGQGSTFCFTLSDEQGSTQGRETAPGASS